MFVELETLAIWTRCVNTVALPVVWACIEKRRRIRRQESDGDGGAREKTERKTKQEVVG